MKNHKAAKNISNYEMSGLREKIYTNLCFSSQIFQTRKYEFVFKLCTFLLMYGSHVNYFLDFMFFLIQTIFALRDQ